MVKLDLMDSEDYQKYLTTAIESYAKEKVLSGNWSEEESVKKAKEEYIKLLPKGEKTENNFIYTILKDDKEIGVIWFAQKSQDEGFIYDINILEEYRGFGYAKDTMKQIEGVGLKLGIRKIGLHVFGQNKKARGLYEKLGYQDTNVLMTKNI